MMFSYFAQTRSFRMVVERFAALNFRDFFPIVWFFLVFEGVEMCARFCHGDATPYVTFSESIKSNFRVNLKTKGS